MSYLRSLGMVFRSYFSVFCVVIIAVAVLFVDYYVKNPLFLYTSVIVLLLSAFFSMRFLHKVFLFIQKLCIYTNNLSNGNLATLSGHGYKGEISKIAVNLNKFTGNIKKVLEEIKGASTVTKVSTEEIMASSIQMSRSFEQVANAITDLAKGASDQALSIDKGNQAIKEVVEGLKQIAEDMRDSENSAVEAQKSVEIVQKSIEVQEEKMRQNSEISLNVTSAINELSNKSQEIGNIIQVIKAIADQTNLLALNATIEAARAGAQGRGFAVVADEIRKLAEQSNSSVKKIGEIIQDVQIGVDHVVTQINVSEATTLEQYKSIEQTLNAFTGICQVVETLSSNMKSTCYSAEVLCESALQAGMFISDIAAVSQEFAAGTEEVSASSEEQTISLNFITECTKELVSLSDKQLMNFNSFSL